MKITREWAMPSKNTFDIPPIQLFVEKYLGPSIISIDPFARDKRWFTYTNDLNPNTKAEYHMDSIHFLQMLRDKKILADLLIFDPPYSPRQIKECYEGIGLKMKSEDAWRSAGWKTERDVAMGLLRLNGIALSFGWNTCGMGKKRGFVIEEILMVCHGATHYDTLCMSERKVSEQLKLF